jgi:hypothetical protein
VVSSVSFVVAELQGQTLGVAAEDFGRQTRQAPGFGGLSASAREMGDDQGKNYGDDSARDRWRDAGPLRNGVYGLGAEALLHLFGADGFVFSRGDPGLHLIGTLLAVRGRFALTD